MQQPRWSARGWHRHHQHGNGLNCAERYIGKGSSLKNYKTRKSKQAREREEEGRDKTMDRWIGRMGPGRLKEDTKTGTNKTKDTDVHEYGPGKGGDQERGMQGKRVINWRVKRLWQKRQ